MNENLNHPQDEEVVVNQPEEIAEEAQATEEVAENVQPEQKDFKDLSFKEKLKFVVPPVIGWCVFAGALVLATGLALLILL